MVMPTNPTGAVSAVIKGIDQQPANPTGAVSAAIKVIDQQIAAISCTHIQGGFAGANEMAQAVSTMQAASASWPVVESAIFNAIQGIFNAEPVAAELACGDHTAQQIAADVDNFKSTILDRIIAEFTSAKNSFDQFSQSMDNAYGAAANANQTAANAIQQSHQHIEYQIKNLIAEENNLNSAGSIVAAIFTCGITYAVELDKLQKEVNSLQSEEQAQQYQESCYHASLGAFNNALNATRLATYALLTLDTSLQQAVNSVNDIVASTSDNFIVMQALLQQFKTEFAKAVLTAQEITN